MRLRAPAECEGVCDAERNERAGEVREGGRVEVLQAAALELFVSGHSSFGGEHTYLRSKSAGLHLLLHVDFEGTEDAHIDGSVRISALGSVRLDCLKRKKKRKEKKIR